MSETDGFELSSSSSSSPRMTARSIQLSQGNRRTKVRTGCNTCKIRHLKCDESKPNCLRCSKSGRQCDYSRITTQVPEVWGDAEERRALYLYRETAGPEMSNYFDGPFWTAAVLRISHESPAAKHILMATGSVYEYLINTSTSIVPPQKFALIQTSKSIKKLMCEKTNLVSTLTCMILFVAYGNLMDDLSGMRHLKSGLQIVQEIQDCPDHPYWIGLTPSEREIVNGLLIPITHRLARFVHLVDPIGATADAIRRSNIDVSACKPQIPLTFTNIRHAEECHNEVYRWALSHLRPANTLSGYEFKPDDESAVFSQFEIFLRAVDQFISQLEMDESPTSQNIVAAAALLKVDHIAVRMFLKATNFTRQSEYDQMEDDYREVIQGSRKFISIANTRQSSLTRKLYFGTDRSCLISLFLVSRVARDPSLRREAIELLGNADLAEGILGSHSCALVAFAAMQIEEAGLDVIRCASDVPESNRIRIHETTFFSYLSQHPQLRMNFCRYPYIPDEDGQMTTETVWIQLTRERPVVWDEGRSVQFCQSPGSQTTPSRIEDIIGRDLEAGEYPEISLSGPTFAWADKSTFPPTYDFILSSHPLLEKQTLRF